MVPALMRCVWEYVCPYLLENRHECQSGASMTFPVERTRTLWRACEKASKLVAMYPMFAYGIFPGRNHTREEAWGVTP